MQVKISSLDSSSSILKVSIYIFHLFSLASSRADKDRQGNLCKMPNRQKEQNTTLKMF